MLAVTGATGRLGRLVVAELLKHVAPGRIVAAVRSLERAVDLAAQGVQVREADYDRPDTLERAFEGVERLLLISGSELGKRTRQHHAAIAAAQAAGVSFVAYTSVLHADSSPLSVAVEHRDTEAALADSGLPYALLRNGWYAENRLADLPTVLERGVMVGAAGDGLISAASRADYAQAAAAVLRGGDHAGAVYELAGDAGHTLAELAAEISRQSGREVAYVDLPGPAYADALLAAGLPQLVADLLATSDVGASQGALFDDGHALGRLLGRPTTPLARSVADALAQGA
ncbi:MAG: SDR family oxidoreductase [Caulobacteraceae bacterium]|nr:SDR family oxidoreductase [Caulobacter sp.]